MTKIWIGIVVLLLVIVAAVWLIKTPAPAQESMESTNSSPEKVVFTWNITERGEKDGIPQSGVTLTSGGKTYDAGVFSGSCAEIDGTSWTLVEGEKTGVICWWAGGGNEIGIFEENGTFVLKVGSLDEGSAEVPGFRGDFQTIATIE